MAPVVILSLKNALGAPGLVRDLREAGVTVLVSPGAGAHVVAVDAARIVLAIGAARIESTRNASLEMDTAPNGSGTMAHLFQQNMVGFLAERDLNWLKGVDAVAFSTVS